jgi:NitT/TauT family transport system permease protein
MVAMARRALPRAATTLGVLLALWGLWELYRWTWIEAGWTWPFPVNDTTLPHLHTIFGALGKHTSSGPLLITVLLKSAWFTAKEAMIGFAGGAIVGFFLAVLLVHSRLMQRAFLPYIVASQTIPILAVAPMVVVWLKAGWQSVAVIAAYLTFFPVAINTLRGLQSAEPRAHELLR